MFREMRFFFSITTGPSLLAWSEQAGRGAGGAGGDRRGPEDDRPGCQLLISDLRFHVSPYCRARRLDEEVEDERVWIVDTRWIRE